MDSSYTRVGDQEIIWVYYIKISNSLAFVQDGGGLLNLCTLLDVDRVVFSGEGGASYTTKGTEAQPSDIITMALPVVDDNLIFSKSLTGQPVTIGVLKLGETEGSLEKLVLYTGLVGKITVKMKVFDLEIVGKWEQLKTPNPWIVSSNCIRSIGLRGCPVSEQPVEISRTISTAANTPGYNAISGFVEPVPTSPATSTQPLIRYTHNGSFAFDVNAQYAIKANPVESILCDIFVVDLNTIDLQLSRYPVALSDRVTLVRHCNRTRTQCVNYAAEAFFAGTPFLERSALSFNT